MGKNKLRKFAEMEHMDCVLQYPFGTLRETGFPLRGSWNAQYFHNNNPIVLELGCGKGEYTVGLARRFPDKNYIGIDIKGARMYTGAAQATAEALTNVAFLRTTIELLPEFFAPGEVSEIWITFPDPQMKKVRKRLTSTRFLELYSRVLCPGGTIHLKTDSPFLYTYTRLMLAANSVTPAYDIADLYAADAPQASDTFPAPAIQTFYEQQWLSRGMTIKYLSFPLATVPTIEPDDEIPHDTYHSVSRRSGPEFPTI